MVWPRSLVIVSFSRKFIFVHTPKTAGESITLSLVPFLSSEDVVLCKPRIEQRPDFPFSTPCDKHSPLTRIQAAFGDAVKGFFTFGFVRNPWDRSVSYYEYLHGKDFSEHCMTGPPRFPCWHWTHDLDFVGRLESLERDFGTICRQLEIAATLARVNSSQRRPYREYFTELTRDQVGRRNVDDIREYGYHYQSDRDLQRQEPGRASV